jgi:ribokinase
MTDVVVVGSVHIDRIMRVDQLPAPGETGVAIEAWTQIGGKAANQAIACAMHVSTALVACVGADTDGQQALDVLQREGVQPRVRQTREHPTGSSAALVDAAGENLAVISPAANEALTGAEAVATINRLEPTVVLCQWESTLETVRDTRTAARAAGRTTLLNAAPWLEAHRPLLHLADHVVVNAVEAAAWADSPFDGFPAQASFGHPSVIVTLGAEGAGRYRDDHLVLHQPAARVQALSTHGAGDHFVGALAGGIARGLPLEATLQQASDAAGKWVRSLRKDVLRTPRPLHPADSPARA